LSHLIPKGITGSLFLNCQKESPIHKNQKDMKEKNTKQEILIATGTSFAARDLSDINSASSRQSQAEKLEEACWNGLLEEWFPLLAESRNGQKLFLWKVFVSHKFLCMELAESPDSREPSHSVNPYLFVSRMNKN